MFATRPGPDGLDREYDIETSLAVQHELARGLSVSGSWFRRSTNNQRRTDNLLVSQADYFPVNIINPLDGTPLTVYNMNPNKRGQLDQIDGNSTDGDTRSRVYNGFELGMSGRLRGASFFGGWTFDRLVSAQCDAIDNPNFYQGYAATTNVAMPGTWCDERTLDMPLRHEFKLSGSYTFPYDIQVNAAIQSYAGPARGTYWRSARPRVYPAELRRRARLASWSFRTSSPRRERRRR